MASILTNTSAMVALQNLRSINQNLVDTQSQIATGKKIATATDNSAIWAVSKVIESDVSAFKAISDSLNLGDSTIAVARSAAETITDLLTELKGNIVAAQEENVDRSKIQSDIDAKVQQIQSIVDAASFNGLSLVEGTADVNILSSLVRDSTGTVTSSDITIARRDLTMDAGSIGASSTDNLANSVIQNGATAVESAGVTMEVTLGDGIVASDSFTIAVDGFEIDYTASGADETVMAEELAGFINALGLEGIEASNTAGVLEITSTRSFEGFNVTISNLSLTGGSVAITDDGSGGLATGNTATDSTGSQRAEEVRFSDTAIVSEGDGYGVTVGTNTYNYIAGPNEDFGDIARGLKAAIDGGGVAGVSTRVIENDDGSFSLMIDNDGSGQASLNLARTATENGVASGGLFGLKSIDVTTNEGASAALENIDTFLNTAIDAAASFGSDQARIDLQSGFIDKLTDSLRAGIGSLVDADLEEASARLQALQVQQQLGIQSLSIANQAPQSILALFR
ncbi:flagellin [Palleronia sp. KMU-117]|uniref:flagellin N-terminal helical domain-containing protein n=1 Tax=Palleronia sp. KMU-117 TaxID=3434108 RepID=UPI003D758178